MIIGDTLGYFKKREFSGWNYLGDFRPTGSWFARDSAQNIKLDGQGQVGSGDYPRREWVHFVVLADSTSTTYYINGEGNRDSRRCGQAEHR